MLKISRFCIGCYLRGMIMNQYGKVILSVSNSEIDKIFDYKIPEKFQTIVCPGCRVMVPFGRYNKKVEGYVIALSCETEVLEKKLKEIEQVLDNGQVVFTKTMLSLAFWLREKYFTTLSQCLQTMLPAGIKTKVGMFVKLNKEQTFNKITEEEQKVIHFLKEQKGIIKKEKLQKLFEKNIDVLLKGLQEKKIIDVFERTENKDFSNKIKYFSLSSNYEKYENCSEAQKKVIELLLDRKKRTLAEIKKSLSISDSPIKTLLKKGVLIEEEFDKKYQALNEISEQTFPFLLTAEQQKVMNTIEKERKKEQKKPILVHGITGSGKTEIYLQLIADILKEGKQAIVLVPEISLTPQIVSRFVSRFGNYVAVTHSRLSQAERYEQWKKAKNNEISIIIGPRSALFTPFENLGVIIIDEEHESSYHSDTSPKYDAREVAQKVCELTGSILLLGSATPDMITYYKAKKGEFLLTVMKQRTNNSQLPEVFIEDMREELQEGNYSVFSRNLYQAMKKNIKNRKQTILFINRRGHSTFVSCRKCGHVMICEQCNIPYTYHASENQLICHYCGKRIQNPVICPACGSKYIKYFGTGTQKIETEVKKLFPQARVLRMDFDTTSKKNGHKLILEQFAKGYADILIGTQMIAKGHDFPNVTLVGIVAADLSLNIGDYKGAEITFQLLTQVAGRAGRAQEKGTVYIQTYQPENECILFAARQDYEAFYEREIKIRKAMEYPPFSNIFTILILGKNEKNVISAIQYLYEIMRYFNKKNKFQILGPSPAFLSKIKNEYRWKIIVKYKEEQQLQSYVLYCIEKWKQKGFGNGIYINLTMNPFTSI